VGESVTYFVGDKPLNIKLPKTDLSKFTRTLSCQGKSSKQLVPDFVTLDDFCIQVHTCDSKDVGHYRLQLVYQIQGTMKDTFNFVVVVKASKK
jgi:hypothetical protein